MSPGDPRGGREPPGSGGRPAASGQVPVPERFDAERLRFLLETIRARVRRRAMRLAPVQGLLCAAMLVLAILATVVVATVASGAGPHRDLTVAPPDDSAVFAIVLLVAPAMITVLVLFHLVEARATREGEADLAQALALRARLDEIDPQDARHWSLQLAASNPPDGRPDRAGRE
jgi:hypothetical protein